MRKIFLSFLRYLAFISLFTDLSVLIQAQVPVLGPETFGTGMALPTGWVATIPASKNGWEMISTVYPSSGYTQPNASGGSHIKVDATAATDAYLYSPFLDCSNYINGVLKFGIWRAPGNDRTLIISVELNGDLDFKKYKYFVYTDATPEREKWFLHTIDLKNLIDHKQKVRIRFGLSATINYAGPIRIDDIVLYARPTTLPTDHFRTRSSGNWNDLLSWESSHDSITWIPSQLIPTYQSSSITIRNAHSITNTSPQTVDQLTVKEGGTLILAHDLCLNDGPGNDLMVEEGSFLDLTTYHITGTGNLSLSGYLKTARPEGLSGHDSSSVAPALTLSAVGINSIFEYNAKGSQNISPGLAICI